MLSKESQERTSIVEMDQKLSQLKDSVEAAQSKLQATQASLDENLQRVSELKAEAVGGGAQGRRGTHGGCVPGRAWDGA